MEDCNPTTEVEESQDWFFTFGFGQPNSGRYVKIHGTCESARTEMFRIYGKVWAFQYNSERFKDQPMKYGLKELR